MTRSLLVWEFIFYEARRWRTFIVRCSYVLEGHHFWAENGGFAQAMKCARCWVWVVLQREVCSLTQEGPQDVVAWWCG